MKYGPVAQRKSGNTGPLSRTKYFVLEGNAPRTLM